MRAPLPTREAELARALPVAVELLRCRRTADVPADQLDAYVALGWLRWAAGRLVVTQEGRAIRDRVVAQDEPPPSR